MITPINSRLIYIIVSYCRLVQQKAKGDIKKQGKPDPYAYVPLMRQKLNRRKQAKLVGQFSGFMKKAKKGSAVGAKQHRKRR